MSARVIADIEVHDPAIYDEYQKNCCCDTGAIRRKIPGARRQDQRTRISASRSGVPVRMA